MPEEITMCPFCKITASPRIVPTNSDYHQYSGCACGSFYIRRCAVLADLTDPDAPSNEEREHISALLRERQLKGLRPAVFHFSSKPPSEIPGAVPERVEDLLARWPENISERIERCFCNLIRWKHAQLRPGHDISIDGDRYPDCVFFTRDRTEEDYYLQSMVDYAWITDVRASAKQWHIRITPKGWAKYDELTRTERSSRNPAFVAMWFGGKDQKQEMRKLFEDAIEPAIKRAGYLAKRAGGDDHNAEIMDRIIYDIRIAPFVVAELTKNNRGVYYEAGFARGRGIDVIYCCREKEGKNVHFDLSGVNQLRWNTADDLREKLEARILGTLGKGPKPVPEAGAG